MHDNRDEITDTFELARRINSSTDIVTTQEGTIDSQQQTIDQTIVQAKNEIIEAFEELTPGLIPIEEKIDQSTSEIMVGITGLAQKIDNIDFTPVEEKLEVIEGELIQGVTGLNQAVDEIKELVSGVTGYAKEDTLVQGLSGLSNEVAQGFTGIAQKIDNIDFTPIENKLGEIEGELIQGFTGLDQKIDAQTNTLVNAVQGITGYALDTTVAKEETLVQGVTALRQSLDNLLLEVEDIKEDIGDLDEILSSVAKQGENPNATNTTIYNKIGDYTLLTSEEHTAALEDLLEKLN